MTKSRFLRPDMFSPTRREVLLALGASALFPACGGSSGGGSSSPATSLQSLRDLVRASPDHLSARAAAVIAAGDFTAAVRFVRDQIAVLPPSRPTDAANDGVRWGPDATLRAGAGTQRERAELLQAMLLAMGATAQIVDAPCPSTVDLAALYAVRPPVFNADSSKLAALGSDVAAKAVHINEPFPDLDPSGVVSSILALIPASAAVVSAPTGGLDSRVPVVAYTAKGAMHWAFALGPIDEVDAQPDGVGAELPAATYPTVTVRLLAAMGDLPGVPTPTGLVELVSGHWTADQLAGGRLLVTTGSSNPAASAGAPADQITIRTPLLQVQRPTPLDGDAAAAAGKGLWSPSMGLPAPAAFGGGPFTLSGAVIAGTAQASDPVVGPYGALGSLDAAAHAAAVASVASIQATANGGAFPQVELTVAALDGSGNPVSGLVQSDFSVTDEGVAQTTTLLSNAGVETIRVMLAYDCSGSVTWPTPADKTAFDAQVAGACAAAAATTPFLLGTATLGSEPADGYIAPDATAIETEVAGCVSFSPIWYTLGTLVPQDGVSAVVMVSDFQADDDAASIPALMQRAARSGVALALVPVSSGGVDQTTIDTLVSTLGATVLDPTAADFQQQLTTFLEAAAAQAKSSGYRFSYRVPDDQQTNQATRTAAVSLVASGGVEGTAPYTVPAAGARGNAGLAGLYLELTIGGSGPVTRRLAGPALDRFGAPQAPVASDFADTLAILNGFTIVALEPGSPTAGQGADDQITGALSLQPITDAVGKTYAEAAQAASGARLHSAPLYQLVDPQPPPVGGPAIAPEWMRVVVATETADDSRGLVFTTDIVPELNRVVVATSDPAAAFQSAVRAGVALSQRESLVMRSTAAASLAGASLQYLPPSGDPTTLIGFTAADLASWSHAFNEYGNWHLLVPTDPKVGAMWVVDRTTGSTVAVFADGSGGGSSECNNAVNNSQVQIAIALLQCGVALVLMECEGMEWGYACAGAYVFGVGASVVALFAGAYFKQDIAGDILITAEANVFGLLPGSAGLAVGLAVLMLVLLESLGSINEGCS